jgi:hypothetical protein
MRHGDCHQVLAVVLPTHQQVVQLLLAGLSHIHLHETDVIQAGMQIRVRDTIWAFITTRKRSHYTWQQWTARPTALPAIHELAQSLAEE